MNKSLDAKTTNGAGAEFSTDTLRPIVFLAGVFGGATVKLEAHYEIGWFPVEYHQWTQPGVFKFGGAIDRRDNLLEVPGRPSKFRLSVEGAGSSTNINGWIDC